MKSGSSHTTVTEVSDRAVLDQTPKLSVLVITYNHASFVRQCIESAATQETAFPYEIVIGEDHSPDETRTICRELQAQYPDRVRLLLPESNIGRHANFLHTYQACRGEYMAVLEGDDYWTSPQKLQKQVDFLATHEDVSTCFHNVSVVSEFDGGIPHPFFEEEPPDFFGVEDLIEKNMIPTCSCCFRTGLFGELPEWYCDPQKTPYADWVLHVLNARHGKIGYIHETMAVYRRHQVGVWGRTFDGSSSAEIKRMRNRLLTYARLRQCLGREYTGRIRAREAEEHLHIALAYRGLGSRGAAIKHLALSILSAPGVGAPPARALMATLCGKR